MHENASNRVSADATGLVSTTVDSVGDADGFGAFPLKRELRRVVQDKNGTLARGKPVGGCLKMASQNVSFVDPLIGEEAMGGLGVPPIRASHGYAFAHRIPDLFQQILEPPAQADIRELASRGLSLNPAGISPSLFCYHEAPSESIRVLE